MIRGGPVAVTIQKAANDSSIQDAGKSFVLLFRLPFRHHSISLWKTANVQTIRVRRTAAKAGVVRRVSFLQRKRVRGAYHLAPLGERPL